MLVFSGVLQVSGDCQECRGCLGALGAGRECKGSGASKGIGALEAPRGVGMSGALRAVRGCRGCQGCIGAGRECSCSGATGV